MMMSQQNRMVRRGGRTNIFLSSAVLLIATSYKKVSVVVATQEEIKKIELPSSSGTCINDDTDSAMCGSNNANSSSNSWGVKQELYNDDKDAYDGIMDVIRKTDDYMKSINSNDGKYEIMDDDMKDFCRNHDENCSYWSSIGECTNSEGFMRLECAPACQMCHTINLQNKWGIDQTIRYAPEPDDDPATPAIMGVLKQTNTYMTNYTKSTNTQLTNNCYNMEEDCSYFVTIGQCKDNPKHMNKNCAPACNTCHLFPSDGYDDDDGDTEDISYEERCPFDRDAPTALNPGDIDQLFERIVSSSKNEEGDKFGTKINVHSFPKNEFPNLFDESDDNNNKGNINDDNDAPLDGPWVLSIEDFLTSDECDRLIELGATSGNGYQRSVDVGELNYDGTFEEDINDGRTSTNNWCDDKCDTDPVSQNVYNKIVHLTGIPRENYENFQLLRYEIGQYYQQHHDYIPFQIDRPQGVRTITVFLYLNDVQEGGGTNFPLLNNMTVHPKKGKVLMWPSVLNDDPNAVDERTDHSALPVIDGTKYAANVWIHQRSMFKAMENDCA